MKLFNEIRDRDNLLMALCFLFLSPDFSWSKTTITFTIYRVWTLSTSYSDISWIQKNRPENRIVPACRVCTWRHWRPCWCIGSTHDNNLRFNSLSLTYATITQCDLSQRFFVLMLRYCANLKAIRYESMSLNRIVADKWHRVVVWFFSPILLYWCYTIVRIWKRYESTSLNRIVTDKSHRVVVWFFSPILLYWCYTIVQIWKRYESTSLNRIVADKSHRVVVWFFSPILSYWYYTIVQIWKR